MKSIVLCEGPDDLWFIAYYLHKMERWNYCRKTPDKFLTPYTIKPMNNGQKVVFLEKDTDCVAVWCVGGKDGFHQVITTIFEKFIENYPFSPVDSLVILGDRDENPLDKTLKTFSSWFPWDISFKNKSETIWEKEIDGDRVTIKITPVIVPFSEEGAIESVLMRSIQEDGDEGAAIFAEANQYIDKLSQGGVVGTKYLSHRRLVLKARYSAMIAATNPDHSTSLFQDMVMSCPWENSPYVREHFGVIAKQISNNDSKND